MQSRESSPQTTEGDQDRLEKAGGDDGRIIDKGDASRAMSRGGEDEMMPAPEGDVQPTTTKEANEGAGINLDPPTVDIPSLANPPVGPSSAQSTALPVQVASISGPLEHLSLDDWKATPGFGRLRKKVEEFLNAENTPLKHRSSGYCLRPSKRPARFWYSHLPIKYNIPNGHMGKTWRFWLEREICHPNPCVGSTKPS